MLESLRCKGRIIEEPMGRDIFHDSAIEAEEVKLIFSNCSAVGTFVLILSYYLCHDETVSLFSIDDGRITFSRVLLTFPDGKGGK